MIDETDLQKAKVIEGILTDYEKSKVDRSDILSKINALIDEPITEYELDNYWRSESISEFSLKLAATRSQVLELTDEMVMDLLNEYWSLDRIESFDYFMTKYSDSIEFKYKKNTGFLSSLSDDPFLSPEEVFEKLNNNDGG